MMQALETFYATYDRYPTTDEGLDVLAEPSDEFPAGMLSFIPEDPWGHPYEYVSPGRTEPFEIISYGADHREGGESADKDMTSSQLTNAGRK